MQTHPYIPGYGFLLEQEFYRTTRRVLKRSRRDGLLNVVFLNDDGTADLWVSESEGIWLITQLVATARPLAGNQDFLTLIQAFPPDPPTAPG